jgi:hypothetical protein
MNRAKLLSTVNYALDQHISTMKELVREMKAHDPESSLINVFAGLIADMEEASNLLPGDAAEWRLPDA